MKRLLPIFLAALVLSGCSTYVAQHEKSPAVFASYHRFWVKTNFDDNHAVSVRIVEELRRRGFEVESGPLTMMPLNEKVVIEYRDYWAWDFRDHMVGLELRVSDAKTQEQIATAVYSNSLSLFSNTGDAVSEVLRELFEGRNRKQKS